MVGRDGKNFGERVVPGNRGIPSPAAALRRLSGDTPRLARGSEHRIHHGDDLFHDSVNVHGQTGQVNRSESGTILYEHGPRNFSRQAHTDCLVVSVPQVS